MVHNYNIADDNPREGFGSAIQMSPTVTSTLISQHVGEGLEKTRHQDDGDGDGDDDDGHVDQTFCRTGKRGHRKIAVHYGQ